MNDCATKVFLVNRLVDAMIGIPLLELLFQPKGLRIDADTWHSGVRSGWARAARIYAVWGYQSDWPAEIKAHRQEGISCFKNAKRYKNREQLYGSAENNISNRKL